VLGAIQRKKKKKSVMASVKNAGKKWKVHYGDGIQSKTNLKKLLSMAFSR
jgi:hypothetical protein